jgi:hypothetical protein
MRKRILAVVLVFIISSLAVGDDVPKIAVPASDIKALLAEAATLSGLSIDPSRPLPIVVSLPQDEFDNAMCGDKVKTCSVLAAYMDTYNLIIVGSQKTADLSTVKGKALLIHELVHYLAQMPLKEYATVDGCTKEESRAYEAERAYLTSKGADASWVMNRTNVFLICVSRFGGGY